MIHQITRAELIVIAARLKQAQDMVGYSNERMATMFGITEIQYSKILRGHSMITEDKLIILKQEMNISLLSYMMKVHVMEYGNRFYIETKVGSE